MEVRSVEAILRGLNEARVRYLVAGGLVVVAHGYVRFTSDLDLVLALDGENLRQALEVLGALGFRPVVAAVRMEDFADAWKRREWIREKDAKVFSLHSADHRMTPIDIFIDAPFDFERAYADAFREEYAAGVPVAFVGLADLLEMKKAAGRPQDLIDIENLERLKQGS